MAITNIDDHRLPDKRIDWKAYNAAQLENGETCYRCGKLNILWGTGKRDLCYQCKAITTALDKSVTHSTDIRCPHCGEIRSVDYGDYELYHIYHDGEHDVTCQKCEKEFTISTSVSYSFTSPARTTTITED